MNKKQKALNCVLACVLVFFASYEKVMAEDPVSKTESESDLAKATQNPVADLISLPFQNNTNFGLGPNDNKEQNILNIQPVIPINLGPVNLINRTIAPIIYQPPLAPGMNDKFGLGDINTTFFISPAKAGKLIWGVGPIISFPTATDDVLGTGKLSLGPSLVVLVMPGNVVTGFLVNNLWSVAGEGDRPKVNQFLLQPFVNYNLPEGWYFTSAPIITANWEVENDNRWVIPIGGGLGKVFKIAKQPMNANVQAFYNVERPEGGPDSTLRFTIQFLFPK